MSFRSALGACLFAYGGLLAGDETPASVTPPEAPHSALQAVKRKLVASRTTIGLSTTLEAYGAGYEGSPADRAVRGLSHLDLSWRLPGRLKDASVAARYSFYWQSAPSSDPTLQGFSNLTAEPFRRWMEAYVNLPIGPLVRLKLGKVDANTEFAVIESAADFSNPAPGKSPTLFAMPSYPEGAPSASGYFALAPWLSGSAGMFRTPEGGLYSVSEANARYSTRRPGRLAAGVWKQSAWRSAMGSAPETSGAYLVFEQAVIALDAGARGLRIFARISTADAMVAPASTHRAYGLTWRGFRRGVEDSAGVAVFEVAPILDGRRGGMEKMYEVYYQFPLVRWTTLRTDLQHVRRPALMDDARAGTVASVRLLFQLAGPEQ